MDASKGRTNSQHTRSWPHEGGGSGARGDDDAEKPWMGTTGYHCEKVGQPTLRRPQKCYQCRNDAAQGAPAAARRQGNGTGPGSSPPRGAGRAGRSDVGEGRQRRRHVMSLESESSDWAFWLTTHLRMCFSSVLGTEKGMSQKRHR